MCAHTPTPIHMCLYEYGSFRTKIKCCLFSPLRISGFFHPAVFRAQCRVFLHASLPCCFCFIGSLLAYCFGCMSHSSFMPFPQFSFTSLCLQILPDFSFYMGAALTGERKCLMLIPFCSMWTSSVIFLSRLQGIHNFAFALETRLCEYANKLYLPLWESHSHNINHPAAFPMDTC